MVRGDEADMLMADPVTKLTVEDDCFNAHGKHGDCCVKCAMQTPVSANENRVSHNVLMNP